MTSTTSGTGTESSSGTSQVHDRPSADRIDPIPQLDLADPATHLRADLQGVFADLRREHPVFWHGPKSHPGFWAVTRHADVITVYRNPDSFSASYGMTLDSLREDRDPANGLMVEVTDPPAHRRLRRSITAFFTAGAVTAMTDQIDGLVGALITDLRSAGDEPVDFVAAVAAKVPAYVGGLLLGLPPQDIGWITEQTSKVFLSGPTRSGPGGAENDQPTDLRERAEAANAELLGYFAKLVRSPRSGGRARGLVQQLAEGSANRDGLTTGEVVLNSLNLAIAGNETTRCAMGNLVRTLIRFPAAYQALREDRGLVPTAVDEAVRWANPVLHLTRRTTREVLLGNRLLPAGDAVVVWPSSANRDAEVFTLPHLFDITRHPNPHVGFATGTHSCPGSGLARLQLRTLLHHLVGQFAEIELAGAPEPVRSNFMQGYERLPIRLCAERNPNMVTSGPSTRSVA